MIDTIVFDIGGVLAHFSWEGSIKSLYGDTELFRRVYAATAGNIDKWFQMDRGTITLEQAVDIFVASDPEIEQEIRHAVDIFLGDITTYDYSEQWVLGLKHKGYKVYILSNYGEGSFKKCLPRFPFMNHVDGAVISYQTKMLKPEQGIYKFICDKYDINPQNAVFLDDLEENVEGARKFGLHGIVFRGYKDALQKLEEMGVAL